MQLFDLEAAPVEVGAWTGLLKPVALQVAPNGKVFVADQGDSKIRVFDRDGRPLMEFGGEGAGPGEISTVRDLVVTERFVAVFDAVGTRFHRFSLAGTYEGTFPVPGVGEETVGPLGPDQIVLASSVRWSLPAASAAEPWPLTMVLDSNGNTIANVGARDSSENPFAAHIRNFVLAAGSPDGRYLWVARLNSPKVSLVDRQGSATREFVRELPFVWTTIPSDFSPRAMAAEAGKRPAIPFDAISYGIAVDSLGRAFILTALESSIEAKGEPHDMSVDVIGVDSSAARMRFRVGEHFSEIAVSPDAGRIYLLDPATGVLRIFKGPA